MGTIEKKTYSLEDIKLFMICILSGEAEREHILRYLCALSDHGGIANEGDEQAQGITAMTIFVKKSMEFLDEKAFDFWIEYFKDELIKVENYELITNLHL